ncbi:hypothetical protein D9758_004015 [Tetrapyrgos nigripes]|uniref:Pheromone receptor n=1 Tax=Tetrapyrgos nigripes TaxID=182062 RepID=A0A8H5LRN3_9AGAR|nr:hypothetical protein D9758_004015 [Tetrapyrgos nigripes]
MSSAATDILYSVLSFLAFVLVLIPLPWHIKARNAGTCLFIGWIGLACLVLGVDSIIWRTPKGTSDSIYTWCDISTKFLIGAMAAMPTLSLCINLRLYFISTDRVGILETRRILVTELVLGLGFPILEMILHFVIQGRRFDIYGGVGCLPFVPNILLTYILLLAPQLLAAIASTILLVLTIIASREIYKKINLLHPGINDHEGSPLTFIWFLTLGGLTALGSICYDGYWIYATLSTGPMKVWVPWNEMHNTSQVDIISQSHWKDQFKLGVMLQIDRWIYVALGLLFFGFFGFTAEARRRYRGLAGLKPPDVERDELNEHELTRIMKSRGLRPKGAPLIISKPTEAFSSSQSTFLPAIDGRGSFFHADPDVTFDSVKEKITGQSAPPSAVGPFSPNDDVHSVASTSYPTIIYSMPHHPETTFGSSTTASDTTTSSTPYASPNLSRSIVSLPSPSQPPNVPLPPVPGSPNVEMSSHYSNSAYGANTHSIYSTSNYSISASSLPLVSSKASTVTAAVGHGTPYARSPLTAPLQRARSLSAASTRTYTSTSATTTYTAASVSADSSQAGRLQQSSQQPYSGRHHRSRSTVRRQHSTARTTTTTSSAHSHSQSEHGQSDPSGPSFLDMRNSQKESALFLDRATGNGMGVGMAM